MLYLRSKISSFLLAVASLRSKTFKIITRYFAFIFGCQILKFTDYLNLLQNTAALSIMVCFFYIFKFSLATSLQKRQKTYSLWQGLSKFQLTSNFTCSTKFKAQKIKFTKSAKFNRVFSCSTLLASYFYKFISC